jgi:phosphomannomutase
MEVLNAVMNFVQILIGLAVVWGLWKLFCYNDQLRAAVALEQSNAAELQSMRDAVLKQATEAGLVISPDGDGDGDGRYVPRPTKV